MNAFIKTRFGILVMVFLLSACHSGETLQHYYVDNQEQPNFISLDAPISILNLDETQLSLAQKEAYQSVKKLNVLAYKLQPDQLAAYESELAKVKGILNHPKYQELMRGSDAEYGQFSIKMLGDTSAVDEFVLFGNASDKGFAIIRVLGKDMDPGKIMSLVTSLKKANINDSQIGEFMSVFK